jgi:hypothetical protein
VIGFAQGLSSIVNSSSLLGGNIGKSFGKTSSNSDTTGYFSIFSVSSFLFVDKTKYKVHDFCILLFIFKDVMNRSDTSWYFPIKILI